MKLKIFKEQFNKLFFLPTLLIIGFFGFTQAQPPAYNSGIPINYVRTWEATAPEVDGNNLMTRPLQDVRMSTQYMDGLGRPLQTVIKKGSLTTDPNNPTSSANAIDLVSSNVYDEFGREQFKYLPFAANNTDGNTHISDGLFKMNPFQQQAAFYNTSNNNSPIAGQGETYFYSKTNFEASPLNRVEKSMAPGTNWAGASRGVEVKNWINTPTDNVKIWKVTNGASMNIFGTYTIDITNNDGKYAAGQLFKTITIDEHGKQVIEFKDKEGKVILKKVQIGTTTGIEDDGTGRGYDGWLSSYYIYDDLNNLRCVIQPEGVNALNLNVNNAPVLTTLLLNEQCFRYEYDQRNRMFMKKVPGAGEVYMVYDRRDRLVMTQDANMRYASTEKWLITKYDELNRPKETGMWQNGSTTFVNHLIAANNAIIDYPSTSSNYETLTLTHYDDYTGLPAGLTAYDNTWNNTNYFSATSNIFPYPVMPEVSFATKGMVTWTQVKVLGTSTFLNTVTYYDAKGRPIQVQSTNLTGGTDIATTQYSWAGQPLIMISRTQKGQGSPLEESIVTTTMKYDDLGRVISVKKKVKATINSIEKTSEVEIVKNEYDQLGQLKNKNIGQKKDENGIYTTTPIESLKYDYNIRGWLLGMNRDYVSTTGQSGTKKFGFELGYDKLPSASGKNFAAAQYNGNITGMVWKSDGDDVKRKYDFGYDAANRLLKGDFEQEDGTASWNITTMDYSMQMGDGSDYTSAYDANGNIKGMLQKGWKLGTPAATIDNLSYFYFTGTNRLQAVTDAITADNKMGDFTDKNTTATDYGYDKNGNLVTDLNKRLNGTTGSELNSGGAIVYNYLNLPESIAVKKDDGFDKGTITYTYDAAGNKLKKEVAELGQPTKTTLYLGGQIYENDVLQFIGMEEGRVRPIFNTQNVLQGFAFDYMIKDHLGNVRMVLTDEVKEDMYPAATMELANSVTENLLYGNIDNTRDAKPGWFSDPLYSSSEKVSKVKNETGSQKIGPNIILKVMAGDTYNIRVASGWTGSNPTNGTSSVVLTDLFSSLINGIVGVSAGKAVLGDLQNTNSGINNSLQNFLSTQPNISGKPKAYINWVLFDEQFKMVAANSSFQQVAASGITNIHAINNLPIDKSGYLYIYTSNESNNTDVFFDNLQVTHIRGALLSEHHYMPFGLEMRGISSKAAGGIQNRYKYNGGNELQSKEFSDGSGMELYDAAHRMYDPQLGRFWQVDEFAEANWEWTTYNFGLNNPISYNDPLGLTEETSTAKKPKDLQEVVVSSVRKLNHNAMQSIYWKLRDAGNGFNGVSPKLKERLERWDGVQRHMDKVHAMTRASDKVVLEIASNFIPVGWITKLRYVKVAVNLYKLKRGVAAANKVRKAMTTVLGKAGREGIQGYEKVAAELGYNSFQVSDEVWVAMSAAEKWAANSKFLDEVVAAGDEIIFSKRVAAISGEAGFFRKELEYLVEKGYRLAADGLGMIK